MSTADHHSSNEQQSAPPEGGTAKRHCNRRRPATSHPAMITIHTSAPTGPREEADQNPPSSNGPDETYRPGGPVPKTTENGQAPATSEEQKRDSTPPDNTAALFIARLPRTSPHSKIRLRIGLS